MNKRHLIDTNVFNIRFPSPQQAQAEQDNGLTDFIKDRLLHIVDQVFTRLCPPQTAIRIDTLELDLGSLPCSGWRDEMAQRLEGELTRVSPFTGLPMAGVAWGVWAMPRAGAAWRSSSHGPHPETGYARGSTR